MNGGGDSVDSLRDRLAQILSGLAGVGGEELQKNSRAIAEAILAKLNVVGREEFDAHCEMLSSAVVRLRELEKQIARLEEEKHAASAADSSAESDSPPAAKRKRANKENKK